MRKLGMGEHLRVVTQKITLRHIQKLLRLQQIQTDLRRLLRKQMEHIHLAQELMEQLQVLRTAA